MNALSDELVADEPVERSRPSVRHWAALVAVCVMFFVVTKGPLFWARLEAGTITTGFLQDVWVQLAFVTSAALVLALAAPAATVLWADRLVTVAFALFLVSVVASSLWAVTPSETSQQSMMFLLSTAAALAAGAYLRRFDVLATLWLAMQVGVGLSLFAWMRDWPRADFSVYNFASVYFHKNSLGPVAMIGVVSSVTLGAVAFRRRDWWIVPFAVVGLVVDGFVWGKTGSLTSALGVAIALGTVVLLSLFVPGRLARLRRAVGVVSLVVVAAVTLFSTANWSQVSERLGRTESFSGRTGIWSVVLDYASERPIGGWGFMSVWRKPDIIESLGAAGISPVYEAHSGYLEVLLGVGLVGFVLLLAVLVVVLARVGVAMWRTPNMLTAWSFGVVIYALVVNLTETFIGPNLLPWVLLCVATGQAVARLQTLSSDGAADGPDDNTLQSVESADDAFRDPFGDPLDFSFVDPFDLPSEGPFDFSFEDPLDGSSADIDDEPFESRGTSAFDAHDAAPRPGFGDTGELGVPR